MTDIIKVSDEDVVWLEPDHSSSDARVEAFTFHHLKIVNATRGAEGAIAYLPDGTNVERLSQKVDVVDTVGAGEYVLCGLSFSVGTTRVVCDLMVT